MQIGNDEGRVGNVAGTEQHVTHQDRMQALDRLQGERRTAVRLSRGYLGCARECRQRHGDGGDAEHAEAEPAATPAHVRYQHRHDDGGDHHAEAGAAEVDAERQRRASFAASTARG